MKMNFKFNTSQMMLALGCIAVVFMFLTPSLFAQQLPSAIKAGNVVIQDNSFLIEEAYNQEPAVIQDISTFMRRAVSHDWSYSFTQEWPINGIKNQFSYTLIAAHSGAYPGSGAGAGDVAFNYRYQLVGSGETKVAVTPRLTLLLPSGDSHSGRGFGSVGLQTNTAASLVLHPKLVTHLNAGATWVPRDKNGQGQQASAAGYNLGQSFIWLAHPRFNVMLETVYNDMETVSAPGKTDRVKDLLISPGIRWAYNFKSGLQIVPGVAVPIGAGPTAGEKGILLYLSFEHPLRILGWQRK